MKLLVLFTLFVAYLTGLSHQTKPSIDVYENTINDPLARIIGGQKAIRRQFPYQASIRLNLGIIASHVCGGTLIHPQFVVTAAHCKQSALLSYVVALGQLDQNEDHKDVQIIKVKKFVVHAYYPGGAVVSPYDIAIIKLATPAIITPAVQIAPLPQPDDCTQTTQRVLSGWGLTSNLLPLPPKRLNYVEIPVITNTRCEEALIALIGDKGPLDDTMICTGSNIGKKESACSGDSGGPLADTNRTAPTLVGIVSWGLSPCGTKDAPTVYTNVCAYVDWINEKIKTLA